MNNTRQQKYARLLQKELSSIFQYDTKHMFGKAFITVTNVRVSPDLGVAKVFLSFMLVDDKNEALEKVKGLVKSIRNLLGEKIRKQVRVIPELIFYLDENVDYAMHMDQVFSKIVIPPAPPQDEEEEE